MKPTVITFSSLQLVSQRHHSGYMVDNRGWYTLGGLIATAHHEAMIFPVLEAYPRMLAANLAIAALLNCAAEGAAAVLGDFMARMSRRTRTT